MYIYIYNYIILKVDKDRYYYIFLVFKIILFLFCSQLLSLMIAPFCHCPTHSMFLSSNAHHQKVKGQRQHFGGRNIVCVRHFSCCGAKLRRIRNYIFRLIQIHYVIYGGRVLVLMMMMMIMKKIKIWFLFMRSPLQSQV